MLLRFTAFLEKFMVEEFKIEHPDIENSELNLRVQKSRVEMFCNPLSKPKCQAHWLISVQLSKTARFTWSAEFPDFGIQMKQASFGFIRRPETLGQTFSPQCLFLKEKCRQYWPLICDNIIL